MSTVTIKEVQQTAFLARLQLQEAEINRFVSQLDDILTYVQQLQCVPTDSVEPTSHVLPLANITRADRLTAGTSPEQVLAMAPARHGQLFKVPKVIET